MRSSIAAAAARRGAQPRSSCRGKLAARLKELVCRSTQWALALERQRAAWLGWLRARSTPRLRGCRRIQLRQRRGLGASRC